jgi:hypothetical protein
MLMALITSLFPSPDFKYQPPESVKDIFWYSDYKEFEILYTFYPNDEYITDYLPKEIVDDFTEYVSERIDTSIENIGFFGVTMYDINDDGTNDYLVTARALPIPYIIGDNDSLYTLYIRDYPAVFLENSNGYDFIPRATTKFNSIIEDTNDGFVMSTKTNGLKDIFLEVQEGFRITYDGKSEYLPENINYSNVFGECELVNDSLCKFTLKNTNYPISFDGELINDYYVCVKFNENNNPFKEDVIYTCNMAGEAVYYRDGYPVNESVTDPFKQGNFVFYIPIKSLEAYKDFEQNRIIDILEIKYVN